MCSRASAARGSRGRYAGPEKGGGERWRVSNSGAVLGNAPAARKWRTAAGEARPPRRGRSSAPRRRVRNRTALRACTQSLRSGAGGGVGAECAGPRGGESHQGMWKCPTWWWWAGVVEGVDGFHAACAAWGGEGGGRGQIRGHSARRPRADFAPATPGGKSGQAAAASVDMSWWATCCQNIVPGAHTGLPPSKKWTKKKSHQSLEYQTRPRTKRHIGKTFNVNQMRKVRNDVQDTANAIDRDGVQPPVLAVRGRRLL